MGGVSKKTGNAGNTNGGSSSNNEKKDKECLVHFRPKDDWKGEYGFDWIREGWDFDEEVIGEKGGLSELSSKNIGKYVCPAKSATVSFNRKSNKFEVEAVPFDENNFVDDLSDSRFATQYVNDHGWKFPVFEDGGLFFIDYGLKNNTKKTVEFEYIYTEVKKEEKEEKIEKKDKKDKKGRSQQQGGKGSRLTLIEVDNPNYVPADGNQAQNDGKKRTLTLIDVETPKNESKPQIFRYKIEYDKGVLQHLEITDESGKSISFGKSDKKKATKKDVMNNWHTTKDFIKRIWNNYNMDEESLPKDTQHIRNVKVDVGSYKKLTIERQNGASVCTDIFEYECCELLRFTHLTQVYDTKTKSMKPVKYKFDGKYNIVQGINKKNIKIDSRCLIDPYLTVRTLSEVVENQSVTTIFKPAFPKRFKLGTEKGVNQYGEQCTKILQAEGDREVVKVGAKGVSKEHVIIRPFSDDGFLHTYLEDYVNNQKFGSKYHLNNDPPTIDWYYFPTLGFSVKTFRSDWKDKKALDKAELKLHVEGTFDKIELSTTNEQCLKLSRNTIKSKKDDDLTVALINVLKEPAAIVAKSKGVEVGHLNVVMAPTWPFVLSYVNVVCKKDSPIGIDSTSSKKPSSRSWQMDKDSHHMDILSQCGVALREEKTNPKLELIDEITLKLSSSNSPCKVEFGDFLVYDADLGENVVGTFEVEGKTLSEVLDDAYLKQYPSYAGVIKVFLLDKYFVAQQKNGDGEYVKSFITGMCTPKRRDVLLIFKKSIEASNYYNSETMAHELLHLFGLHHSFDNRELFTFKHNSTSNVMDYVYSCHSLSRYQWEEVSNNLAQMNNYLNDRRKEWRV